MVDDHDVAGRQLDDTGAGGCGRGEADGRPRSRIALSPTVGEQQRTHRRRAPGLRRGQHRSTSVERKTLSHKGNIGPPADGDHRREIRPARVVARQHVVERVDEAGQWILDQVFELFPSHLDARAAPGKLSEQFRGNVGGQSFLCRTALLPELAELPDRGGTGRIDVIAVPELVDDPKQQSLVDLTTGKVLVPCRGTNGLEIRRPGIRLGLHQGDVSRGATEIKQPHHTAVGQAQFRVHRGQRRDRIGNQARRHAAADEADVRPQTVTQCVYSSGLPMRGNGNGDLRGTRVRTGGQHHRIQRLDQQEVWIVHGSVGRHQRHRISNALNKAAH
ncbi:Uncharacterised protein [Mycobacterium tuberculosis]|nr:Uncharacterised protein [Mycobacterium tuberculosis]